MKLTQNRQQYQSRRNNLFNVFENKENLPLNAPPQLKKAIYKTQNIKMGQQIKQKIKKMFDIETHKDKVQINKDKRNKGEKISDQRSPQLFLTKSVSFEERVQSPGLSRHNSKRSILKNSLSKINSSKALKDSQISVANSHIGAQDSSTQYISGNKIIKDKYQKTLATLWQMKKKYTDEVYPPLKSSIYLNNSLMKNFCQMFEKEGRSIEWMRISELFPQKRLTVWMANKDKKSYISNGPMSKSSDYLSSAFNLIGEKKTILQKMFQGQQINSCGIYYVKIHQTQQNIWKYVIIDDYIPVIVNKKIALAQRYLSENVYPAFLNVQSYSDTLQIWPFLLQKAYAKYYSTYDSLANGFVYDFVQELTGVFLQSCKIRDYMDINKIIKNQDALVLAQDKKGVFFPIKNSNFDRKDNIYTYLDKQSNFIEKNIGFEEFVSKFNTLHYAYLHKYYCVSKCQIQQQNIKSNKERQGYILRHITIEESGECQMAVIQKQQRFYRSLLTYQYVWMRLILVQQETSGYRWIESAYSNHKTVKISTTLNPGKYILIIMPEWGHKKYDLNLMFNGTTNAIFERQPYEFHKNIIEESCMDLAQRFGKLAQISKNICSYHYIQRDIGFVIENINNQKQSGNVRILRSIQGLQKFNIRPINPQFKNQPTIQVVIPCSKSYTVVLMTSKGVQQQILDMFDFGS